MAVLSGTQVITKVDFGSYSFPYAIGVNPKSGYVYVVHAASNTVSVVSGTQVVEVLPAGSMPSAVGVNPETGLIYVVNRNSQDVTVISENMNRQLFLPLVMKNR